MARTRCNCARNRDNRMSTGRQCRVPPLPRPVLPQRDQTVRSLGGRVGHPRAPSRPSARHGAQRSRIRGQRGGTCPGRVRAGDLPGTTRRRCSSPSPARMRRIGTSSPWRARSPAAFRTSTPLESDDVDGHRSGCPSWTASLAWAYSKCFRQGPPTDQEREALHRYAGLVGHLVVIKGEYGDVFEFVRRRAPMSVAAELQWSLLPPLTFGTEGIVISGLLEPAYEVGGDSFDYAERRSRSLRLVRHDGARTRSSLPAASSSAPTGAPGASYWISPRRTPRSTERWSS